jgi:Mg-chelatase subunit ChlD
VADAVSREQAKREVARLTADGGTAMGRWLALADRVFGGHSGGPRHVILLTDGCGRPRARGWCSASRPRRGCRT